MKNIIFINTFLFVLVFQSFAQKGYVVDNKGNIIPYVNISFIDDNGNFLGWTTGKDGAFRIANQVLSNTDSLTISCIGYFVKTLPLSVLIENEENVIVLESKNYNIAEVTVTDAKIKTTTKTFGTFKNKSDAGGYFPLWNEIALFIPNKEKKAGYLKNVKIKLVNAVKSELELRIHVYSACVDKYGPQQELLKESVLANSKNIQSKWVVIDIEKYKVVFPKEGLFIGFEFLPPDGLNIMDTKQRCIIMKTDNNKPLRVQRGFVHKNDKCYTWIRYFQTKTIKNLDTVFEGGKWYFEGDKGCYFPKIGLTNVIMSTDVIFYK